MKLARDGYDVIAKACVAGILMVIAGSLLGGWWLYIVGFLGIASVAFTLFFFRDPDRVIPDGDHLIIAPADGKVIDIKKVMESRYFKEEVTQISIFSLAHGCTCQPKSNFRRC